MAPLPPRHPAVRLRHPSSPSPSSDRWFQLRPRDLLGPAGRAGWGLADQGLTSLSNLAVGLLIARSSSAAEFGVYALAFGGYTIALNLSRAIGTEPLAVRHSGDRNDAWAGGVRASTATAFSVGLLALLVGLGFAALPGVPSGGLVVAFAVSMPAVLLEDSWRWAFFVVGEGRRAFVNDLVWLLAMAAVFAGLFATGNESAETLVLGWGAGAAVAAVVGRFQSGLLPDPRRIRGWLRAHRDLTPKYAAEMLALSGTIQAYLVGITAVAGITAVSGIRGAQVLLGPVNVLNQGIRVVAVPEAARALKHSARRLRRVGMAISVFVGGGALCWGGIFLLLPDAAGRTLLGPAVWAEASAVLLPVVLLQSLGAANAGAFAILRALEAAGRGLLVRLTSSVLLVTAAITGAAVDGATGAAWTLALAAGTNLVLWWLAALHAAPKSRRTGA